MTNRILSAAAAAMLLAGLAGCGGGAGKSTDPKLHPAPRPTRG